LEEEAKVLFKRSQQTQPNIARMQIMEEKLLEEMELSDRVQGLVEELGQHLDEHAAIHQAQSEHVHQIRPSGSLAAVTWASTSGASLDPASASGESITIAAGARSRWSWDFGDAERLHLITN
jgi:hypothetical protein